MITKHYPGLLFISGKCSPVNDILATEELLNICINEVPFTITMRTPGKEAELARGLLFSEGIYTSLIQDPEMIVTATNPNMEITAVNMIIPGELIKKEFAGSRNIISASSCGICGKTSLDESVTEGCIHETQTLDPAVIAAVFKKMKDSQEAFQLSGGTHACGAFTIAGDLISIQEDIGRHNAVDKVIGDLLLRKLLPEAKILTVSGRISYEIVSKALSAGIPFLASVSAPSSMAVEHASKAGQTLLAFCRNDKLTVYTHPERVVETNCVQVNR